MIKQNPTREEFEEIISHGKTLVDFWAPWCGPCRAQAPIAEELERTTDVDLIKVNVDEDAELSIEFDVSSIPTLLLYEDGVQIARLVGLTAIEELKEIFKI